MTNLELCRAAMYHQLGQRTKLSASGYNVIFAEGYRLNDRADLSEGIPERAEAQLKFAGIDPSLVTQEQLEAYQTWQADRDREHSLNGACILVTGKRRPERGSRMWNEVILKDGRGEELACHVIKCLEEWDSEARNHGGGIGGFRAIPNANAINEAIAKIQREFPDYADAPIQR
ncbi:hypothetical protein CZ787_17160 [Halomonas citrativorans]|uniref:Uncharacterized protein n=1 Tax=Halomonas citrativorans TaxID=2742612 RepID=A0A1R4I4V8_9GAMM|nr:hypothetical protein [Halomonas citrativorans]SJN14840.1 hypothetical protein CZ787_17160 [Halomonas citrativorans]